MEERSVIFVFLLLFCSAGCKACFTTDQSEESKIKTGSSLYLECRCTEPGSRNLKWIDIHNQEISPLGPGTKSNVYTEWQDSDTYSLYISNLSKTISGAYKCVTEFNGQQHVLTYNVEAYDPPYFVHTQEHQYVVNGESSLVKCEARGENGIIMSWHKDEDGLVEITRDDKYNITSQGLVIRNVTDEDNGVYKCTASHLETGEGIDKDITVMVMSLPVIVELVASPEERVLAGESLSLECLASGEPRPQYFWNKIQSPVASNSNVTWKQVANRIVFEDIATSDRGTYECIASNKVGNVSRTVEIDVLAAPNITQFINMTVAEGSITQIVCKASGIPQPNIIISFEGEKSDMSNSIVWDTKHPSNNETVLTLTFLNVNRIHEGLYTCNATNQVDSVEEIMQMSVLYHPSFDNNEEHVWTWNGKAVNLSCEHDSNPQSIITWRFFGANLSLEREMEINRDLVENYINKAVISGKKLEHGVYECTVANDFGQAKKLIFLSEGFPPPPIQNMTIIETTSTSVTFQIDGPLKVNGPPIIGYTSEYDECDNYNITDIHINRTWSVDRPFRLDKLKPNTTYYVKFAPINIVGRGAWSETYDFVTLEKSTPEEPAWEADAEEVAARNQVLKWKTPDNNGEPIDYYSIRYCPVYAGTFVQDLCTEERINPTTEFQLDKMDLNTTYYLELLAHNALGNSSAAHIYITLQAILKPEPLLSAGALIGISVVVVFLCLVLLDFLLLLWRRQGIIANCCYKKNKKKDDKVQSRDKKGLLRDGESAAEEILKRPGNGHKEFEYNKTTGVITGKHSAV